MKEAVYNSNEILTCKNCISGNMEKITFQDGAIINISEAESDEEDFWFVGPGLTDLQINGINGIDFNNPSLTEDNVIEATKYLLGKGVTSFFPTVITNSDENIIALLQTINNACLSSQLVNDCIPGLHLEGPFISPEAGAKGAHDEQYIKAPDWALFEKFQAAAGGRIKLVTIAPEWYGSASFIKQCSANGVLVSIGHSLADSKQIENAVEAGAILSTHLGNGLPLMIRRHPNIIWDQLAADKLYTCIITDGIHIPEAFIKVVIKNKVNNTIVVSDATCFAGMPPGEYQNHIGGTIVLDDEKRISLKSAPGLLAGAAKDLLENVEHLVNSGISSIGDAWRMASVNVTNMLIKNDPNFINRDDKVIFRHNDKVIEIKKVIKEGEIVYEQ